MPGLPILFLVSFDPEAILWVWLQPGCSHIFSSAATFLVCRTNFDQKIIFLPTGKIAKTASLGI